MLIKAVKLENAKSYDNAQIDFTTGVNAIVGHNGAGKSTILEAIGFAMFDYLSYTHSEFVRSDARTASVTVTFESNLDERYYEVVRRAGGVNQHYIHDPEIGARICEGKADVLAFLREHLGVDSTADLSSLFRDAVGVAQGTFTAAFLGTPAHRKAIFDPLLQVEDYRKSVELLRHPARLLNERRQELEISVAQLRGRLEGLPALERAVRERCDALLTAEAEAKRARSLLERSVLQRSALETVRTELVELRSELGRRQDRGHALARELAAARQALSDAQAARELVEKHTPAFARYQDAQERQKELDAQVRERQRLESERAAGDKSAAVAETKLNQMQQDLSEIEAAAVTLERLAQPVQQQEELETQLDRARQDVARLREVESRAASQRELVADLVNSTEKLKSDLAKVGALEARTAALREEEEETRASVDQLRDGSARFQTQAEAIKEQTRVLEDAETAFCPVCEQPLSPTHRDELIIRNQGRLESLRTEYREVQSRISALQTEAADKRKELQHVERELRDLPRGSELERLERDTKQAQAALEQSQKQQADLSGAGERIDDLQRLLAALGNPKRERDLARSQLARKEAVTAGMRQTLDDLNDIREGLAGIQAELVRFANLDRDMDACAVEIRACEEPYQIVLGNRRLAVTVDDRASDVDRLQSESQALVEELGLLSQRVEATAARFDNEEYEQVTAQERDLRGQVGASEARIEMLSKQQEADQASVAELQQLQTTLAGAERQVRAVTEQSETLDAIRKLLGQAGPYVTRVLIRQISDNARQLFSDIMQDYTRHLAWNEDYGVTLEVDGHSRQFSQLSGGEQMTAALAVRLSLLRELSSIDVAFFDEPTANLDEPRRESLARQILEVKGFRQLFVISHDDTFEQATQNLIRVEKANGISIANMD